MRKPVRKGWRMTFEPGDTVALKIGGPLMLVEAVRGDRVYVMWFDARMKQKHALFRAGVLRKRTGGAGRPGALPLLDVAADLCGLRTSAPRP